MTHKGLCVQEQILDIIREGNPLSTSQLAQLLKVSWHTVQHYCFELVFKGKIEQLTIGSSHIWIKKGCYTANENNVQEQFLTPFTEKQLTTKIDEAMMKLLDREIIRTVKEVRNSLKKKEQKTKQKEEKELYGRKE